MLAVFLLDNFDPQLRFISQFMQNAEFFSFLDNALKIFCFCFAFFLDWVCIAIFTILPKVLCVSVCVCVCVSFVVIAVVAVVVFICFLLVPWPALGHCQGDSLNTPMLITTFDTYDPKVTGNLVTSLSPKSRPDT